MSATPELDVVLPRAIYDFLMGAAAYDGVWFGELNEGLPGPFWWRAILAAAERESASSLRAKDAEIAGLREALERSRELVCNAANTGFAEEECRAIYAHNGKISDVLGDLRARTALNEEPRP